VGHPKKLNHISLCTGYGGIDLGLSRALGDVCTVAYVEIESFAVENLVSKIESELLDMAPIWSNLKTFPWSLYRGKVDILSGGFPCQLFSSAGRRAGDEDPRHLFPYILNGIRQLGKPPLVFLENVEGIISSKLNGDQWSDPEGTPVLLHVLRELERLGYDATAGVFSAREVGAPHQRKRVFILGVRSDLGQSGRDIVSGMLRDTESEAVERMGEPHARGCESPERRSAERWSGSVQITESSTAYPAPRGAEQYAWEPPRVTAESSMGRELDGAANRVDYAELSRSLDNRTDELRLLGNGVVPDTAERAFRQLWRSI